MNRYGQMAMDFGRERRPTAFAQLEDPEAFYSRAGQEIAEEVGATARRLEEHNPGWGSHQARMTAEELVLSDHWLLIPEPGTDEDEDPIEDDPALEADRRMMWTVNEAIAEDW